MSQVHYEAEAAVLGTVLLDGTLFSYVTVTEEQFESRQHQLIFRAIKYTAAQEQTIDLVTVTTNLGKALQQVGGTTYLVQLAESVPSTNSLPHYEQLMVDAYRNRKSRQLATRYAANPSDQGLETLITELKHCQELGTGKQETENATCLEEITNGIFYGEAEGGRPTSYTELDAMTGGLQPGELVIIAARPSVGKTAFALNLAAAHCRNDGMSSFFSFEMRQKQLLQRVISAEGNIHSQKWRSMAFNEQDFSGALHAIGEISTWKFPVYERVRTIHDIRTTLRKTIHDYPDEKHIALIDYLQLITPAGQKERRDLEVGEITRELKLLAVELNIPIVLLSQLSRSVEQRNDKRPFMSDLRESGNIEQDADMIAFLYRDDYYDRDSENKHIVEVIVAKQRNGPTGTVELAFLKEYGSFQNLPNEKRRKQNEQATNV